MNFYKTHATEQEAEAAAIAYVNENGPISFYGMNCNNNKEDHEVNCGGWDGVSRRCECGNRRVCWETDMINGLFTVFATAY